MRRRHIKKLALNARRDRASIPVRGTVCSKKLRRRRKAWDRAGRAILREDVRRLENCREFLVEVRDCKPDNELERSNLEKWEKMAVARIARLEANIERKKGRAKREEAMDRILKIKIDPETGWHVAVKQLVALTSLLGDFIVVPR